MTLLGGSTFDDGKTITEVYPTRRTEGNTAAITIEKPPTPDGSGGANAMKMFMPFKTAIKSRCQLVPAGTRFTDNHEHRFYSFSSYLGADWNIFQVVDNGTTFSSHLQGFRFTSTDANGPGNNHGADVVSGVPKYRMGTNLTNTVNSTDQTGIAMLGNIVKQEWVHWLMEVIWTSASDGLCKVWRNGVLVRNYAGRQINPAGAAGETRMGFYQGSGINQDRTVWIGYHLIGTTMADVDVMGVFSGGGGVVTPPPPPVTYEPKNVRASEGASAHVVATCDKNLDPTYQYSALRWATGATPPPFTSQYPDVATGWHRLNTGGPGNDGKFTANPPTIDFTDPSFTPGTNVFVYMTEIGKNPDGTDDISAPSNVALVTIGATPADSGAGGGGDTAAPTVVKASNVDLNMADSFSTERGNVVHVSGQTRLSLTSTVRQSEVETAVFIDMVDGAMVIGPIGFGQRANAGTGEIINAMTVDWQNGNTAELVRRTLHSTASQTPTSDRLECRLKVNGTDIAGTAPVPTFDVSSVASGAPAYLKIGGLADGKGVTFQVAPDTGLFTPLVSRSYTDASIMAGPAEVRYTLRATGDITVSQATIDEPGVKGATNAAGSVSGGGGRTLLASHWGSGNVQLRGFPIADMGGLDRTWLVLMKFSTITAGLQIVPIGMARSNSLVGRYLRLYPTADPTKPSVFELGDQTNGGTTQLAPSPFPHGGYNVWQLLGVAFGADGYLSFFKAVWPADGSAPVVQTPSEHVVNITPSQAVTSTTHPNSRFVVGGSLAPSGAAFPGTALKNADLSIVADVGKVMTGTEFSRLISPSLVATRQLIAAQASAAHAYEADTASLTTPGMLDRVGTNNETFAERLTGTGGAPTAYTSPTVLTGLTGSAANETITKTAHGLAAGMTVQLSALTGGTGLPTATNIFVVNTTTNTFQVATTAGGTPIDFTTDVTAGTLTVIDVPYDPAGTTVASSPSQVASVPQATLTKSLEQVSSGGTTGQVRLTAGTTSAFSASGGTPAYTPSATPYRFYYSDDNGATRTQIGSAQASNVLDVTGIPLAPPSRLFYAAYESNTGLIGPMSAPVEVAITAVTLTPMSAPVLTAPPSRSAGGNMQIRVALPPVDQSVDSYHVYLTPRNSAGVATGSEFLALDSAGTISGGEVILNVTGLSDAIPRYGGRLAAWRTEP